MAKDKDLTLYHLSGPGLCGRGVKMRLLSPSERDEADISAAKAAGEDNHRYLTLRPLEGARRMIVAVTKERNLKDIDAVRAASWHKCSLSELEAAGEWSFECKGGVGLFSAKDASVLEDIFRRTHDARVIEVDVIMGKAISVSDD